MFGMKYFNITLEALDKGEDIKMTADEIRTM